MKISKKTIYGTLGILAAAGVVYTIVRAIKGGNKQDVLYSRIEEKTANVNNNNSGGSVVQSAAPNTNIQSTSSKSFSMDYNRTLAIQNLILKYEKVEKNSGNAKTAANFIRNSGGADGVFGNGVISALNAIFKDPINANITQEQYEFRLDKLEEWTGGLFNTMLYS